MSISLLTMGLIPIPSGSFTPADLSQLYEWYDSGDTSTISLSSGFVTKMNDKSDNNFNLTPAVLGPASGSSTINGLNVLDFVEAANGSSTLCVNVSAFPTDWFICFVGNVNDGPLDGLYSAFSYEATNDFQFDANSSGQFQGRFNESNLLGTLNHATDELNNLVLWTITFDSSGNATIRVNGVESVSAATTGTMDTSQIFCLAGNRANNRTLGMKFCEYVCSGGVNATDISNTESYLADRWGITI